jgi:vacuolar-type H+-ATPase subunit E/Vma4
MGIKEIVDKILEEGERASQEIISNAEKERERRISEIKEEGEKLYLQLLLDGKRRVDFEAEQNVISEKTKLRIKILEEKNKVLSEIYEKLETEIYNLPEKEYKELMKRIILKHCTGGEEIIVGEFDKGILDEKFVEEINQELRRMNKKEIICQKNTIKGARGVIIKEGDVEKNFLLPSIFRYIREATIEEVNKILFSELNDEIGKFFL